MKYRDIVLVVFGFVLAAVVGVGVSVAKAQPVQTKPSPEKVVVLKSSGEEQPLVYGEDLAIRVDLRRDGRVVGTLMARVDGRWQPVELSSLNALAK